MVIVARIVCLTDRRNNVADTGKCYCVTQWRRAYTTDRTSWQIDLLRQYRTGSITYTRCKQLHCHV